MTTEEVDAIPFAGAVVYRQPHDRTTLAVGYVLSFADAYGTVLLRNLRYEDDDFRVPCVDVLHTCPDPRELHPE